LARRNEHLVVIMLEPMPPGVEFEVWPLHITIVPWFHVQDDDKLDQLLIKIAQKHKKLTVSVDGKEIWGTREKFEVALVNDPGGLQLLHEDVFHSLEKNGYLIHQKDYLGAKYRPHFVSRNEVQKTQDQPKAGQEMEISSFWLVKQLRLKKSGRMIKELKKQYPLSSQ